MKQLLICNLLFIKRNLKKFSFILLLISIPLLCYLLNLSTKGKAPNSLKVGLYLMDNSGSAKEIADNLTQNYESVHFELCDDLSVLKRKVVAGTYECGYVFTKDFNEKLAKAKCKHLVTIYASPSTIASGITSEYLFSEFFKDYAYNKMSDYLLSDGKASPEKTGYSLDELKNNYNYYLNSDETFSFRYVNPSKGEIDTSILLSSFTLASVRGLVALLIMFAAFIGVLNLYKDDQNKIFYSFTGIFKPLAKMAEIFSITLLASVSGLIAVYVCGLGEGIIREILRLLVYSVICSIYFFILYKLIKNRYVFATIIPLLIIGSVIFCPIFFDFSTILPVIKYISYVFVPRYYFL